jgi:hypothetical protein
MSFCLNKSHVNKKEHGKAVPVTGCGGQQDYMTPRLPTFSDNHQKDGCEDVHFKCMAAIYAHEDSWYLFVTG